MIERLRELCRARPFRPFVIHMVDGRTMPVRHPELLALGPKDHTVMVYQLDESFHVVDVSQVTRLEVKPRRATRGRGSSH